MNADANDFIRTVVDKMRWIIEELWPLHQNLMIRDDN